MLNFANLDRSSAPAAATKKAEKPVAQVYLNVGITVDVPTGEVDDNGDAVIEPTFVAIPVGIAVDTMQPMEIRGKNVNWANMVQTKNHILKALQEAGAALEPGQSEIVSGLELQLLRRGEAAAPVAGDNPMLAAVSEKLKLGA